MPASLLATTADYTSPATITWSDVPGLSFVIPTAGIPYYFDVVLMVYTSVTTNGHTVAVNGPASPTYLRYTWTIPFSTAAAGGSQHSGGSNIYDHAVTPSTTTASIVATAPAPTTLQGVIVPATTGTLTVRIKPEGTLSVSVVRGSYGMVAY